MRYLIPIPLALALMACDDGKVECTRFDDCGEGRVCENQICVPAPDAGCMRAGDDTTCDGIDDDCDGLVDEGWQGESTCGVGACRAASTAAACVDGEVAPCAPGAAAATDDTCDAIDDDCDGAIDEGWRGAESCGVGACLAASTPATCVEGVETPCAPGDPAATDDTCDGIDDDCDGMPDEGWQGEQTCGEGPCADSATPATCVEGVETACVPGAPADEACNGRDDDCDGAVDETFDLAHDIAHCGACGAACAIANGVPFCDDGACRLARCVAGFSDCNADAADGCETEGPCPPDSTCDGIDDDGDGRADEGFVPTTGCGVGLCGQLATPSACVDGQLSPCRSAAQGVDANCNGLDEDCDGIADEDYAPRSCGRGACAEAATPSRCEGGVEVDCAPGADADEVCDGMIDEDCDGAVDEGFDLSADPQNCGRCGRICARPGAEGLCIDGDCVPGPCAAGFADCNGDPSDGCEAEGACPPDAACDGIDDDGDGRVDEGFVPAIACGAGACAAGVTPGSCVRGELFPCRPGPQSEALDETCDGIDGDCDGRVDEGFAPDASCGVGACAAGVVPSACVGGVEQACAVVVDTMDETCDRTDEDCDGAVDEGFGLGEPCSVGVGLCARAGRVICVEGAAGCDVEAGREVADADCDGLDADCDGVVDEGFVEAVPAACVADVRGACASEATPERCVEGGVVACVAAAASAEVCDGIDNDCDNSIDEQALRGFDPIYIPLAVDAVNVPRRSRDASLAWSGDSLAVSWWEKSTDDPDLASWRAAFTLLDADGAPRLAGARVLEDIPGRHPRMLWDDDAFVAVWHRNDEPDGLYSTRIGLDGAQRGGVLEVAPGGFFPSLQSLVLGPAGPLVGWHLVRGGPEGRDVRVDRIAADSIAASTQITSNDVADRGPALAAFGDTVGAAWRQWPDGDDRDANVWFRRLNGDGRPLGEPVEVGHLGGSAELPDADVINDPRVSVAGFSRGFEVIWTAEVDGMLELRSRRISPDGQLDRRVRSHIRPGRLRSRTVPALWVPELQSTVIAWSEQVGDEARIFLGQLDPVNGELTRAEPLPAGPGAQVRPTALAWLGDRLAVAYEESRGPDDWRLVLAIGTVGCGRDRCRPPRGDGMDRTCDGIDDDCDGLIDEDYIPVAECGIGGCAERATAASACVGGRRAACVPGEPQPEVCNNTDDDCDGIVDEVSLIASSSFDDDTDGWTLVNIIADDPERVVEAQREVLQHVVAGGLPGGHIRVADVGSNAIHFSAPAHLLGDRSTAVGGSFRFQIRADQVEPYDYTPSVTFYAAGGQWLRYLLPFGVLTPVAGQWTEFSLRLTADRFVGPDGQPPSNEELLDVFSALDTVLIPGEWLSGDETTDLDSVEWVAPPCP